MSSEIRVVGIGGSAILLASFFWIGLNFYLADRRERIKAADAYRDCVMHQIREGRPTGACDALKGAEYAKP